MDCLLSRFATSATLSMEWTEFVSRFAASALTTRGGTTVIKRLAAVLSGRFSDLAMTGWLLEAFFFARLRDGGLALYIEFGLNFL